MGDSYWLAFHNGGFEVWKQTNGEGPRYMIGSGLTLDDAFRQASNFTGSRNFEIQLQLGGY